MFIILHSDLNEFFPLVNALMTGDCKVYYLTTDTKGRFIACVEDNQQRPDAAWFRHLHEIGGRVFFTAGLKLPSILNDTLVVNGNELSWEDTSPPLSNEEDSSVSDLKWQDDVRQAWGKYTEDGWIDPISGIEF